LQWDIACFVAENQKVNKKISNNSCNSCNSLLE